MGKCTVNQRVTSERARAVFQARPIVMIHVNRLFVRMWNPQLHFLITE